MRCGERIAPLSWEWEPHRYVPQSNSIVVDCTVNTLPFERCSVYRYVRWSAVTAFMECFPPKLFLQRTKARILL